MCWSLLFAWVRHHHRSDLCPCICRALANTVYRMPSVDSSRTVPLSAAMSTSAPLRLEPGTYTAASSQGVKRRPRSQSLRRHVSKKAEHSSDALTTVYRALRKGETPKCLRQVIPDATHSTILLLHMFPCAFLFVHLYFFGVKPAHRIKHRVRPYLIISTTLKAHLDICCMSHPMGYVSNNLNLYFSAVNCVI